MPKTNKLKRKPKETAKPRKSFFRRILIWGGLAVFLLAGAAAVAYAIWASTFDLQAVQEMPSRSTVFDVDAKVYSRLQGENRIVVPLSAVSKYFIDSLLVREDTRFYSHRGVDPIGIMRAVLRNLTSGGASQGASTLTQQLARNSFPDRIGWQQKTLHRKLLEAFVAIRIEQQFSKEQILGFYVNRIYFGNGVYGIEAASQAYFGKHASELSLGESAMIAGIIRSPTFASPFQHPDRATKARDSVLDRMVTLQRITAAQAATAKSAKLLISKRRPIQTQENYAMDAVVRDLNIILSDDQRAQGGLKIYTTIDPVIQKAAEQAVDAELKKVEARPGYSHTRRADFTDEQRDEEAQTPYLQGAAVVIENRSGAIRALVGGRDYGESKYNRAIMSQRQVGSTFKPFVYAAAFRRGLLPGALIDDGPIARGEVRGAPNWTPDNSDNTDKGTLRAEEGLVLSRNTMSVRIGQAAGIEEISKLAASAGLGDIPKQPAIYLGAFEESLSQMTAAYTILPNNGVRRQSYVIERIDDAAGDTLYRAAHIETRALDAGVSWLITSALGKVLERGTAAGARALGWTRPAAGKTGTTNDYKDAWFIGYTSSLTCGVWVGFDKPQQIMAKGYGAALALPIWADIMNSAPPKRYVADPLHPPAALQRVSVCAQSNGLATTGCERAGASYAIDLPPSCVPRTECSTHRGGVLNAPTASTERRPTSEGIFKSFKRFFGGK